MEWFEIRDDADIQHLNALYGHFEDSVIVSMEYVSGNYIDAELCGQMHQKNDLRVVFQRLDRSPFSIELWFTNTKRISLDFVNPQDGCLSDILYAKVCRNNESVFWAMWDDFDPNDPAQILDTALIESNGLKWRVLSD